jgi:hypothetical protein
VVLPAGDHDRIGCFTDQVKLTRALVQDLDEAIKEVKLLGRAWGRIKPEDHRARGPVQESKGRFLEVGGREGHP